MANKILTFLGETKTELKKVTWPTRQELSGSTVIVLLTTAIIALFVGFCDFIFSFVIRILLR